MTKNQILKILVKRNYRSILNKSDISFSDLQTISPKSRSFVEAIHMIKKSLIDIPICVYKSCNNKVNFLKSSQKFSIACCEDHAKKFNNLQKYGVENVSQSKHIKEKKKTTCLKKYGVQNPKQDKSIAIKIKDTMIKRYGGFGYGSSLKTKIENTNLKRYGRTNPMKTQNVQNTLTKVLFEKIIKRLKNIVEPNFTFEEYNGSKNKNEWRCLTCEKIFTGKIDNGQVPRCPICFPKLKGISFVETKLFNSLKFKDKIQSSKNLIPPLEIDIVIPSKKLAIEINGIYWHSETQGKDEKYHLNKTNRCYQEGFNLLHFYDVEIIEKKEIVLSMIYDLANENKPIESTELKEIDEQTRKSFLEENHLFGDCSTFKTFGLFKNSELLQILGLSENLQTIEFICSRKFYENNPKLIIGEVSNFLNITKLSFRLNRRFESKNRFERIGFKSKEILEPQFQYVDFKKNKLIESTEPFNPNYSKIWDCGYELLEWIKT